VYNAPAILWGITVVVKQKHFDYLIVPGLMSLLALVVWLGLMIEFRLDDSFITYRYAQNFAAGSGLVYNTDEKVLSTTAPLYAMFLGVLSHFIPDFHVLGGLIGTISIAVGGWLIYFVLPNEMPIILRVWAGIVYTLSPPLWLALGMETPVWIAMTMGALVMARHERIAIAGFVIGLATLVRPDALLPGALLGAGIVWRAQHDKKSFVKRVAAYGVFAVIPIIIFAIWAGMTYGSPFPATLGAKNAQAILGITGFGPFTTTLEGLQLILQSLVSQSGFYVIFAVLIMLGLSRRLTWEVALLAIWAIAHILSYIILRTAPYRWYYNPLIPAALTLSAYGLWRIRQLFGKRAIGLSIALLICLLPLAAELTSFSKIRERFLYGGPSEAMLPIVDWDTYHRVGEWIDENTPKDSTVGVAEVGQVGFYARRWMTDYLGLLQPEVAGMLRRSDLYSWLVGYAPDYLVFQRFRGAPLVLYNYLIGDDDWFLGSYRIAQEFDDPRYASGPVTIFERVTRDKPIQNQQINYDFGGLKLIGLGTDGYDLSANGNPIRVRLDWEVTGEIPPDLHIALKGLGMTTTPAFDGDYVTRNWRGTFSTWHGLVIPENTAPGGYPIEVAIGPTGGPYTAQNVGWFDISFDKLELQVDSVVFQNDNEAEIGLNDSNAIRNSNNLVLETQWQALQNIDEDYTLFVHIVPIGETSPTTQLDTRPIEGSYPTFLWEQGEVIPLTIQLDNLPHQAGTYDVLIGWYETTSGERLKIDDTDVIHLTQVIVD
jgi:arabinofuranosyltransferase